MDPKDTTSTTPPASGQPSGAPDLVAIAKASAAEAVREALAKMKATNHMGGVPSVTPAPEAGELPDATITGRHMKDAADGHGLHVARFLKALATAQLVRMEPEAVAKSWGYTRIANSFKQNRESIQKALAQGTLADGGAMVPTEYAAEFIELLRNWTAVRKAGARVLPMGAALELTKQTGAGTAYWGLENNTITASQQTVGKVVLQEKKLTARTEVSNDLIRNASVSAEEFVRDDLLQVISIAEDLAFIRGSGAAGEPRGIRYWLAAAHVVAETCSSDGNPTLAEAKAELNNLVYLLKAAKAPMLKPVWLFSPRTETAMLDLVGPGAEGTNSLEREMLEKGTLRGYPFFPTQQIPDNLAVTGTAESELYFVDMSQVIIGESMALELLVFPNGGDTGIQKDQTTIRAIKKCDLVMRHDTAGAVVKDLSWGG